MNFAADVKLPEAREAEIGEQKTCVTTSVGKQQVGLSISVRLYNVYLLCLSINIYEFSQCLSTTDFERSSK